MFVLQNAQFNGIFFDEENVVNAIGDFQNATIKKCKKRIKKS